MLPRLIGLHGVARSGKDTVGEMLAHWGYQRLAFADEMRSDLLFLNPWIKGAPGARGGPAHYFLLSNLVEALGWDGAKQIDEVRQWMLDFGTGIVRGRIGQDVWVNRTMAAWSERATPDNRFVFTDVRFDNEAAAIRDRGGVVVRVTGRGGLSGQQADHASEAGICSSLVDLELVNDGTLADLAVRVAEMVEAFDLVAVANGKDTTS